MAALSREENLKGGIEHTNNDRKVKSEEIHEIHRTLNGLGMYQCGPKF